VADLAVYILTLLALLLVIEGMLYVVFAPFIKKIMALALALPVQKLRFYGLLAIVAGITGLALIEILKSH
jgi:uncharacterized protein YjeT (DUF2065 family)